MKNLKFLQAKGCIPIGYVGKYPDEEAELLVARGIAEFVREDKTPTPKKLSMKENSDV